MSHARARCVLRPVPLAEQICVLPRRLFRSTRTFVPLALRARLAVMLAEHSMRTGEQPATRTAVRTPQRLHRVTEGHLMLSLIHI